MAQESRKSELIATLAAARRELSVSMRGVGNDLNVVRHVETSFQRHRLAWFAGAGGLGFLLTRLRAGRPKVAVPRITRKDDTKKEVVKAGLLVTVVKLVFDLVRPALTKWLTRRVATYAAQRFGGASRYS